MNSIWKQPARLWCRRDAFIAGAEDAPKQIASGSLEDMVRSAGTRDAADRQALFIDIGAKEVLAWPDISRLRSSPSFPVEI